MLVFYTVTCPSWRQKRNDLISKTNYVQQPGRMVCSAVCC